MSGINDYYWIVANDPTKRWSSKRAMYVDRTDATYLDWLEVGRNTPTRIDNEILLVDVLRKVKLPFTPLAATATGADLVKTLMLIDAGATRAAFNPDPAAPQVDPLSLLDIATSDPRIAAAAVSIDFLLPLS